MTNRVNGHRPHLTQRIHVQRDVEPGQAVTARPRLSFVGLGYLGATYAICFAELGYQVLGLDVDAAKVAQLSAGLVPFYEPGLQDLLTRNLAARRIRFTTDCAEVATQAQVHFVCVGTPSRPDSPAADLSYLEAAVTALASRIDGHALIVGKSTVPVGTTEWVRQLVDKHASGQASIEVVWSPEFLQEGFAVNDVLRPARIVYGIDGPTVPPLLEAAHRGVLDLAADEDRQVPVVVTDCQTAELSKVAANAFLATKISFINAMAEVCEAAGGGDVTALARALGHDPRIGHRFLRAGIGFGGACLPKDIRAFLARAREIGAGEALRFLHEVDLINQRRQVRVLTLAAEATGRPQPPHGPDLSGLAVGILGVTFKPHSDDVRQSPALAIAQAIARCGAAVTCYDPAGVDNARHAAPELAYAASLQEAVTGADLVCVLTQWEEFRTADPAVLAALVTHPRVIDGRNCLDRRVWTGAGWDYRGMGASSPRPVI